MFTKEIIQKMINEADYDTRFLITLDTITSHGGYSSGSTNYDVEANKIKLYDSYITINILNLLRFESKYEHGFETTAVNDIQAKEAILYVPYENIKTICSYKIP